MERNRSVPSEIRYDTVSFYPSREPETFVTAIEAGKKLLET